MRVVKSVIKGYEQLIERNFMVYYAVTTQKGTENE